MVLKPMIQKNLTLIKEYLGNQLNNSIGAKVLPWYQQLPQREQRLLLSAMVILPVLIFVFGLWLPIEDKIDSIRKELPKLQQQVQEARVLASKIKRYGRKAGSKDLLTTVEQSARKSNVRSFIVRLKPQPGPDGGQRLQIRMQSVPYPSLVYFLGTLAQSGVGLGRVKMLGKSEQPGYVDVNLMVLGGKR